MLAHGVSRKQKKSRKNEIETSEESTVGKQELTSSKNKSNIFKNSERKKK